MTTQALGFGLRVDVSPVPEPAAWMMALAGLSALALRRRLPGR